MNSDRIMDYNIWYLPEDSDAYELHMVVPMSKANCNVSLCTEWLVRTVLYFYVYYTVNNNIILL